jgi:RNA polymerase sigma-70 factor (ECF subfamily)
MLDTTLSVYLDSLYGYAMVLTRDATVAADLVLETYVRGLSAIKSVKADCLVKSWLFTILRTIWLNQLPKQCTALKIVELNDENSADVVPEIFQGSHALGESKLEPEQVREAIQQLPVEFSEIIILREHEELSCQEIATLLECSPQTVVARLARARSKLRILLSESQASSKTD